MTKPVDFRFFMVSHGGKYGPGCTGPERFRLVGGTMVQPDSISLNDVANDKVLKWLVKNGNTIEIVPLDDYPAPPGLKRYVRK